MKDKYKQAEVVEVFEEFMDHPAVKGLYFATNQATVAASLTAAYFGSAPREAAVKPRAARKRGGS